MQSAPATVSGTVAYDTSGAVTHDNKAERSSATPGHLFISTLRISGGSESESTRDLSPTGTPAEERTNAYGTDDDDGVAARNAPGARVGMRVTLAVKAWVGALLGSRSVLVDCVRVALGDVDGSTRDALGVRICDGV